jgi:hypothetical protein
LVVKIKRYGGDGFHNLAFHHGDTEVKKKGSFARSGDIDRAKNLSSPGKPKEQNSLCSLWLERSG